MTYERLGQKFRCGKSHTDLRPPAEPVDLKNEAVFDPLTGRSASGADDDNPTIKHDERRLSSLGTFGTRTRAHRFIRQASMCGGCSQSVLRLRQTSLPLMRIRAKHVPDAPVAQLDRATAF
jgi:hypothetical protein